jgi:hypothetical protein
VSLLDPVVAGVGASDGAADGAFADPQHRRLAGGEGSGVRRTGQAGVRHPARRPLVHNRRCIDHERGRGKGAAAGDAARLNAAGLGAVERSAKDVGDGDRRQPWQNVPAVERVRLGQNHTLAAGPIDENGALGGEHDPD